MMSINQDTVYTVARTVVCEQMHTGALGHFTEWSSMLDYIAP